MPPMALASSSSRDDVARCREVIVLERAKGSVASSSDCIAASVLRVASSKLRSPLSNFGKFVRLIPLLVVSTLTTLAISAAKTPS
eukprot:scaffold206489_cov28-Tisochrysis_lutea.AAC.9